MTHPFIPSTEVLPEDLKLSSVLDALTELVLYQDLDNRILWANKAAAEVTGMPAAQMVGLRCYEAFHQRTRPCPDCPVGRTLESGQEESGLDFNSDGTVFEIRGYPVTDDEGAVVGAVEVAKDVTARVQAEEKATTREAEQRFLAERLVGLIEVLEELEQAESVDAVCRRTVELMRERLSFERAALWRCSKEPGVVEGTYGTDEQGRTRDERTARRRLRADGPVARLLQDRLAVHQETDVALHDHRNRRVGRGSLLVVPLHGPEGPLGFLAADTLLTQHAFTDGDVQVLRTFGAALGNLLGRKEEERRSTAFARLAGRLNRSRTPRAGAQVILDVAHELLGWDAACFQLRLDPEGPPEAVLCFDTLDGERREVSAPRWEGDCSWFEKRLVDGPRLWSGKEEEAAAPPVCGSGRRPAASLYVPLPFPRQHAGLLSLHSDTSQAYNERDLVVLQSLAEHAAGALVRIASEAENRRQLRAERDAERTLAEQRDELEAIYENAPGLMALLDEHCTLVRANRTAAEYTAVSPDNLAGFRCGQALQCVNHLTTPQGCGFGAACARCGLRQSVLSTLRTGEELRYQEAAIPVERQGESTVLHFLVSTKPVTVRGEKRVLVSLNDVTDRVRAEEALRHRLGVEAALSSLSRALASDGSAQLDGALAELGIALAAHRVSLLRFSEDGATCSSIHEWCGPGVASVRQQVQGVPREAFAWCIDQLQTGEPLAVPSVDEMPDEAAPERERLKAQAVRSLAAVPLCGAEGSMLGVLRLDDVETCRQWNRQDFRALRVAGDLIAGCWQRELARESLAQSEAYYRALTENAPDGVVVLDAETRVLWASNSADRVLGYEPGYLIGKVTFDFIHPEDVPGVRASLAEGLRSPSSGRLVPCRLRHHDGSWRDIHAIARNLLADPVVHGIVVNFSDMTERREAEREARRERDLLRALMDSLPDTIYFKDRDRRFTRVNQAQAQLLGLHSPEEAIGKTDADFFDHAPLSQADEEHLLTTGEPLIGKLEQIRGADGRERWVSTTKVPLRDADGAITGLVGVTRDVTDERQAREFAERQSRLSAIGQLAAGIAHDFNNALAAIVGGAEVMSLRKDLPDDVRHRLDTMVDQGMRAAGIVRQILDFSRKTVFESEPLDLATLLTEVVDLLRNTVEEHVTMNLELAPGSFWMNADAAQLQQVFTNLAVNARDAMPEGGMLTWRLSRLVVGAGEQPPVPDMSAGPWALLEVEDTGVGMEPEVLAHVFEPFFTTKEIGRGTGLGLAQVFGLVSQHGGFADVCSEPGKGTTFKLYFPLNEAEAVVSAEDAKPVLGSGQTLLVVEDDDRVRETLLAQLEALNYQAVAAHHGRHALACYEQHRDEVALVLTDVVMPEMGGVQLLHALRAAGAEVPVVALTGYPLGEEPKTVTEAGFAARLQKPLSLRALGRALHQALGQTGESLGDTFSGRAE